MIFDTNLENYPATVVNNTSVNPVPADGYIPLMEADGLHTYLIAKPNGGALWKIVRPALPNSGNLGLQFNWMLSAEALLYGRCFEFDTRVTDQAGWTYPCDFQFILESDGLHLFIATGVAAGKITWQDTGLLLAVSGAGQWTVIDIEYGIDTVRRTCSVLSVANSNQKATIPAALQNQPAAQLGWTVSQAVLQKQIEAGANGGAVSDVMKNIQYIWK